ncbi:hypothetical protein J7L27_00165 [Candidatus Bathyarchaeota archaeon]|nr:hypothetical protein [Candidatus Bathyarchaeota archaeon]
MKFADLHLRPPVNQFDKMRKLIEKSAELGYSIVGLTFPINVKREYVEKAQKICKELGLDMVTRADLTPKNSRELLSMLRKIRRKFEVIGVNCQTKQTYIQAAKDRRVDLISAHSGEYKKHFFGKSEAKLASEKNAALEVNLTPLLYTEGFRRVHLLNILRKEISAANKFSVPIVLSSGAENPRLLRKPSDYAALTYLLGLDLHSAKLALSVNPISIVERNRRKLSPNYICPGVYLVKRGKDC